MNTPIITTRLSLREYTNEDWLAVHAYASLPEVCRHETWGPNSEEDTRRFIATSLATQAGCPRQTYQLAIVLRDSHTLIGGCALFVSKDGESAEIGFTVHPAYARQGVATEAGQGIIKEAWRANTHLQEIRARCAPLNVASQRLLRRLGLQQRRRDTSATIQEDQDFLLFTTGRNAP